MNKLTIIILSVSTFLISIAMSLVTLSTSNGHNLREYLIKMCSENDSKAKCLYVHEEYNPFTYKHTYFYQMTNEATDDNEERKIHVIQTGSKSTIDEIFEVSTNNEIDTWIELGRDVILLRDNSDFKKLTKGQKITKAELYEVVNDLDKE